jgi:hypothetical protein
MRPEIKKIWTFVSGWSDPSQAFDAQRRDKEETACREWPG